MKHPIICSAVVLLTALALAGCAASSTQGPMAWLDQPLDGAKLPMEPQELTAHASDADGVTSLEFYVNGALLVRSPVAGGMLADATVGWDPSAPGVYTVAARATDSQGNTGPESAAIVTVGQVEGSPTPRPTGRPTEEIVTQATPSPRPPSSPAPTVTPRAPTATPRRPTATVIPPTATPRPPAIVSFEADPRSIAAGAYVRLSWAVTGSILEVRLGGPQGEGVGDHDFRDKQLFETTTFTLWARGPGGEATRNLTVNVAEAPTPTPKVSIITPEPIDVTPPVVSNLDAYPPSISAAGQGCGGTKTTTVSVFASDPSGVTSVVAYWTLDYQSGQVNMTPQGGDLYQTVLGPFDLTANLLISFVAWDTVGNATPAVGPIAVVVHCIG